VSAAYSLDPSTDKFQSSRAQFEQVIAFLESADALQLQHGAVEERLTHDGRELLRRLFQDHLNVRSAAERRLPQVTGADGARRRESRELDVGLGTVFGGVRSVRLVYQAAGLPGLAPMDAVLNLSPGYYSHGIRKLVAEQAAKDSFEEVVAEVEVITGCAVGKRQVEELAAAAASDFDVFYTQYPAASWSITPTALLVLSFDGKGIVVRTQDLREATRKAAIEGKHKLDKRLAKGEKRNRKRMAEVATVYAVEPFVRDAEDVLREFRPAKDVAIRRPRPTAKRVWASVVQDMADVIEEAFSHAGRLDPDHQRQWVVLVDGNKDQIRAVRKVAKKHGVSIVVIVDVVHVLEYLWKAAYCFHADGSQAAQDWVTQRLRALLTGSDPSQIAAGMRRSATRKQLPTATRKPVDACARYLINNRRSLNYAVALECGFPIATGVVEGACRYLIKDRMDRTGARWSLQGAEAVLRLRALRTSGDLLEYWAFHLGRELQRNHLSLYADQRPPNPLPPPSSPKPKLRRIK
jgi:hypothetical protein